MDDPVSAPSAAPRTAPAVDPELLVAQYGWVRSVANHLVRDRGRAEDVTQETVLAALTAPPRDAGDAGRLRAWLGRVAFNLSKLGARQGMRRRAREERAARREAIPSVFEEVVSQATLRELGAAVAALPDQYREVVELRYFDGLSTADVAERVGCSDLAVRKRLWRARGKLRERLEGEEGPRRAPAWLAPLTAWLQERPWAALPAGAALAAIVLVGTLGSRTDDSAHRASALASTGAAGFLSDGVGGPGFPTSRRPVAAPGPQAQTGSRSSGGSTPGERPPRGDAWSERPPRVATTAVDGLVVALDGAPVAGLELADEGSGVALARSDRAGAFRVVLGEDARRLIARGAGWTTVVPATLSPADAERAPVVVVAPSAPLAGGVVSGAQPLEGAAIEIVCTEAALVAVGRAVRLDSTVLAAASTGPDGTFALAEVPRGAGIALRAGAPGYVQREVATLALGESLWLELEPDLEVLSGLVCHLDGSLAAGAHVRLGMGQAVTDRRGRFRLPLRAVDAESTLEVSGEGLQPVRRPGFGRFVLGGLREGVTLTLGEPLEAVEGLLTGPVGEVRAGWRVLAFAAAGGADGPREPAGQAWSDAHGRFHLRLARGRYSLVAVDGANGSLVTGDTLDTGHQPWTMEVASAAPAWVEGELVRDGESVSGARLELALLLGDPWAPMRVAWQAVDTAGDGRWRFRAPMHAAFEVRADVAGAEPGRFHARAGLEPIQLALVSTGELLVEAPAASTLRILDGELRPLTVRGPLGPAVEVALHSGRSPVLEVGAGARWVVLGGPDGERWVPFAVEPHARTELRVE